MLIAESLYFFNNAFGLEVAGEQKLVNIYIHTLQIEDSNIVGLTIYPNTYSLR
jgi:hypothetical protein